MQIEILNKLALARARIHQLAVMTANGFYGGVKPVSFDPVTWSFRVREVPDGVALALLGSKSDGEGTVSAYGIRMFMGVDLEKGLYMDAAITAHYGVKAQDAKALFGQPSLEDIKGFTRMQLEAKGIELDFNKDSHGPWPWSGSGEDGFSYVGSNPFTAALAIPSFTLDKFTAEDKAIIERGFMLLNMTRLDDDADPSLVAFLPSHMTELPKERCTRVDVESAEIPATLLGLPEDYAPLTPKDLLEALRKSDDAYSGVTDEDLTLPLVTRVSGPLHLLREFIGRGNEAFGVVRESSYASIPVSGVGFAPLFQVFIASPHTDRIHVRGPYINFSFKPA